MTAPVTVGDAVLRQLSTGILKACGVPEDGASVTADSLVAANLRGVDSHGVQLLPHYVRQLRAGNMDPRTAGRILSESGGCLHYDGKNGLGQVVSWHCCGHAARLASTHGVGLVVARDSNHFGAAAYWAERITAAGQAALILCNAAPMVAPWQGREPRFGTNPICAAVPSQGGGAWLLDMATTTVAMGKIYKAAVCGEAAIPPGWAMDSKGQPTTDTREALDGGMLMPLGGYKGSGLAMLVEVFCAVLGGGALSTELGGIRILSRPMRCSQWFLAIDVRRFMPLEEFQSRMEKLVGMVKSTRTAPGYDEVLVAGDPEWREEAERLSGGIPLAANLWEELLQIAGELGVTPPALG